MGQSIRNSTRQLKKEIGINNRTGLYYKGEEIILRRKPGRPPRRISNPENGWWSMEKKIEAATIYAATGDVRDTANLCEIPEQVIRGWKTEQWWIEVQSQITSEEDEKIVTKFTHIVNEALDKLIEVVQKGNRVYNPKTDSFVDIPLTARDLTTIASSLVDKRQLIQGKPTSRVERNTPDDRLKKLAEEFAKFSRSKTVEQVVDEQPAIEG